MGLIDYCEEKVRIVSSNGRTFEGVVTDYFYPDDNENGKESIAIDNVDGTIVEFYEEDIASIVVL